MADGKHRHIKQCMADAAVVEPPAGSDEPREHPQHIGGLVDNQIRAENVGRIADILIHLLQRKAVVDENCKRFQSKRFHCDVKRHDAVLTARNGNGTVIFALVFIAVHLFLQNGELLFR